ncbi:MAG: hypothetical protein LBM01_02075 [Christensenellaceae bacterium]|jgi:stage III sporulation protein AA|nr:hypothetical protein [Christensenellaceae bacterium]
MNELLRILPEELKAVFMKLPLHKVYEIRFRVAQPILVNVSGRKFFLSGDGLCEKKENALILNREQIDGILHTATNYSFYAVNEQIKQGFITIAGGIRIGITGEVVEEKGEVITLKNIQALNVRIPHEIKNASLAAVPYIFGENRPLKTLVIAPPGAGKTTFLRDIANQISEHYAGLNVLILDERGEIASVIDSKPALTVGDFADIISGGNKTFGFRCGLRSMSPDVIITDEIATQNDIDMIREAARSGVSVMASVHAGSLAELKEKPNFRDLILEKVFDRYVVLRIGDHAGVVDGVYDSNAHLMAK